MRSYVVKAALLSVTVLFPTISGTAMAKEDDPVEKVRLAVSEADLVLSLIQEATAEDPLLDKMCLRLGRYSAISRRIKDSTPVPPEETRIHYVHYEHFCGWDPRPTDKPVDNLLPRAFSNNPEATLEAIKKLEVQLRIDRNNFDAWYQAEKAKQSPAPASR